MTEKLEVVITATLRPSILDRTLASIKENLHYNGEIRTIVNIDPIGEEGCKPEDIIDVGRKYFRGEYRIAETPSFVGAIQWTLETVLYDMTNKCFVNFEDDWEVLKPVDMEDMLGLFDKYPELIVLHFDREHKSVLEHPSYSGDFKQLETNFWWRHTGYNYGGSACIMRKNYAEAIFPHFRVDKRPDYINDIPEVSEVLANGMIGTYTGKDGSGFLVRDIGRGWKEANGFIKRIDNVDGERWDLL